MKLLIIDDFEAITDFKTIRMFLDNGNTIICLKNIDDSIIDKLYRDKSHYRPNSIIFFPLYDKVALGLNGADYLHNCTPLPLACSSNYRHEFIDILENYFEVKFSQSDILAITSHSICQFLKQAGFYSLNVFDKKDVNSALEIASGFLSSSHHNQTFQPCFKKRPFKSLSPDILFTDIDGTVISDDPSLTENNIKHLKTFLSSGNIAVLVSKSTNDDICSPVLTSLTEDLTDEAKKRIFIFQDNTIGKNYLDTEHVPFGWVIDKSEIVDSFLNYLDERAVRYRHLYAVGDNPLGDLSLLDKVNQRGGTVALINPQSDEDIIATVARHQAHYLLDTNYVKEMIPFILENKHNSFTEFFTQKISPEYILKRVN